MAVWRHRVFGKYQFSSVQFSHSAMSWLCNLMNFSMPGLPVHHLSRSLLKFTSIKSAMLSYHLILCLSLILLPSIFPSIKVFSKESVLHIKWPRYWSFRFSISPFNEYSELISFRINLFDVLAVQETLKSLLQQPSSKASIRENKMVEE